MSELQIVYVATADLVPYARNAKTHPPEQIAQIAGSLKEFGFINPVIIDGDRSIVAGHGRVLAAQKLGLETVPTIAAKHLTPTQVKAFRLADNRIAQNGSWDVDILKIELEELDNLGIDLAGLGFDEDELPGDEGNPGLTDPDEVPEEPKEIWVKRGDLFELGNHRLLCGDSTKREDVDRLMAGEKADITFTSPPYNAGVSAQLRGNTSIDDNLYGDGYDDDKTEDEWLQFVSLATQMSIEHSRYQFWNVQFLAGNRTALPRYWAAFKDRIVDVAIWNKGFGAPQQAAKVMNSAFEFVFIFTADAKPSRAIRVAPEFRGSIQNVFEIPPQRNNEFAKVHGATFPVAFPEAFVTPFCPSGGSVLELFSGTGTTLIACEKTGRRCYGMEIDPAYCQVILERWSKFSGKQWAKIS